MLRSRKDALALLALSVLAALAFRRRRRERSVGERERSVGEREPPPGEREPPTRTTPRVERAEPPLSDRAYDVVNPVMERLLRSPLHGLVSDSLTLVTFTGRETGTEYTTPVGYWELDGRLVAFTHSDWWRNLEGGQPVRLHLRGEEREGVAEPVDDPSAVADRVRRILDREGVDSARRMGLRIEGDELPDADDLRAALDGTVAIEIELTE